MSTREALGAEALKHLLASTAAVPASYFHVAVAETETPTYRERVYCYELYHQMRMAWPRDWALSDYTISGELHKANHPKIREHPLLKDAEPDLLIHRPGAMDNLVAVEVKRVDAKSRRFMSDVETVGAFVQVADYVFGVCLVFGAGDLDRFRRYAFDVLQGLAPDVRSRVLLIHHSAPGEPAVTVPWSWAEG
jgi:hypothetical protein